jgi:hypothetical protein
MAERTDADIACGDNDRRHSPRFKCGGDAKISHLPSDGIFVPGKIFDLSLGGCCVDTTLPMDFGVRTEIVVRVNAASFRVVGEVRANRGRSGAGIEFVHLSAGGKHMLADLVTELARLQAVMKKLNAAPREMDAAFFRKQLKDGKRQAAMLSERFPFLRTILPANNSGESARNSGPVQAASAGKDRIVEVQSLVLLVDLFG